VATWIVRLATGPGLKVALKDLIDVAGIPTTAGSRALARRAAPAPADAVCLAGVRAAVDQGTATIVGKTNLHELAFGITGVNQWFGTPGNPLDGRLAPGGSSSGAAVAVASGEADIAIGTDTGGSVRIPAACCGVAALKTTWGRVSTVGVRALAPSLDTVGPIARDVEGLTAGMALLEPGFVVEQVTEPATVGRFRFRAAPRVDAAIDAALAATGATTVDVELAGWVDAGRAALTLLGAEAWVANRALVASGGLELGADVAGRLRRGSTVGADDLGRAAARAAAWKAELGAVFGRVEVVALPTLADVPPTLERAEAEMSARATLPVNLAGFPALVLPVPARPLPASLQLVGPPGSEARLLALGGQVEAAVGASR